MNPFQKIVIAALLAAISPSFAHASEARENHRGGGSALPQGNSKTYLKECGACHLAYQPQLLPQRSWEKIMASLDRHFGDSATLDETTRSEILSYLAKNSAEKSSAKISGKLLASLTTSEAPLRISDTPYFKRKHREVRADVFKRKSIASPANCGACHPRAEKGEYDEHKVKIPKN